MRFFRSISTRVAASAAAILGAVGCAVIVAVYAPHQEILREEQIQTLAAISEEQHQFVADAIRRLREDVQFLAGTPPIAGIAKARATLGAGDDSEQVWRDRLETIFLSFMRHRPEYVQVRLIGLDGGARELVRVDRATSNLFLPIRGDALQRKGDADYVRESRDFAPGSVYLSNVNLNREYSHVSLPPTPVMRAVTPVFLDDGNPYGLIVINQDLTNLFDSLQRGRPREAGLYLTDAQGNYLINTETNTAFGFEVGRPRRLQEDLPAVEEFYSDPKAGDRSIFNFERREHDAVREYAISMTKIHFDPAESSRTLVLGLYASYEDLLGASWQVGRRSALAAAALIVGGAIVVLIQMKRVLEPLQMVVESTERVAAGDYHVELPRDAPGEIGQLAAAFRIMAHQVEERNRSLEERAEEIERQQQRLRAQNAELEKAHHELAETTEQLSSARQYKSEFLARSFHDVRAPVNNILLLAKALAENDADNLTSEQTEATKVLTRAGEDLMAILNDLMDLSKIEAGRLEIRKEPTSIREIFNDARQQFALLAEQQSIQIDEEIDPSVPEKVRTDPRRLKQIIWNLVSNAIKYTDKGTVTLAARLDEEGAVLVIEVADTGAGIPEGDLARIFKPYHRLERDAHSERVGTGLGLAIVQELALALGAELRVESRIGEGSRFALYLPLEPGGRKRDAQARVLIADDDLATRFVLERQFRKADEEVELEIVEDGLSAIEAIRTRAFDCAILDLHLPLASGLDVLRMLAVDRPQAMPRVLLYSGAEPLPRDRAEAERLGATVLVKQGDPESVARVVERALGEGVC